MAGSVMVLVDNLYGFGWAVGHSHEVRVLGADIFAAFESAVSPLEQAVPVSSAVAYHGVTWCFSGLYERENLKKFIHSAKSARHENKRAAILGETHLARKEIVEINGDIRVLVATLLVGKLDV